MYEGKTLVVLLCMHRSGSSLVANLLQRLGMSLGPFELLAATEHNKYGHFEAVPFYEIDKEVQTHVFGFSEDIPDSAEVLRQFCEREGHWSFEASTISPELVQRGTECVRQLLDSGTISGFKDPRVPLVWPYWQRVFAEFPGLRIVPVLVLRSPHEIAMSIFVRSRGNLSYNDALDVTAVHYKRLHHILEHWGGDRAVVRFDPRVFAEDMQRVASTCNLAWNEEAFSQVYDASCRHQERAVVAHEAQEWFDRLSRLVTDARDAASLQRFEHDAAVRENTLRGHLQERDRVIRHLTGLIEQHQRHDVLHGQEIAEWSGKVAQQQRQLAQFQARSTRAEKTLARYRETLKELGQCRRQIAEYSSQNEGQQREIARLQENLLRSTDAVASCQREIAQLQEALARSTEAVALGQRKNARCQHEITQLQEELLRFTDVVAVGQEDIARCRDTEIATRDKLAQSERQLLQAEAQLALIAGSRTWRLRQRIVRLPPVKWLANAAVSGGTDQTLELPSSNGNGSASARSEIALSQSCTIIIPVYNAFAEALRCVRSVLEHTRPCHRILVVDDCSSAGRFADELSHELLNEPRVRVLRNEQNVGFVKTCNMAMRLAAPLDVVLLNSDAEVTPGWLEKLRRAAASQQCVGTVTPLTNNGTICSVPKFLQDNALPAGYSVHEFAALVEAVSTREYPALPTCVGFCVYIKREVIDRIGMFDEEAFGKGYGEENDFSCRLHAAGYLDILDDATFVYHHGQMSFQADTPALVAQHLEVLGGKHPHFAAEVDGFIAMNPLRSIHERIRDALLARWNESAECAVLHILHHRPRTGKSAALPGGTEYHVADLIRTIPEAAHWSLYAIDGEYCLTAHVPGNEFEYRAPVGAWDLSSLLSPAIFDVLHVHQFGAMDYSELAAALARHGRYFVSVHDYRMCCPRISLLTPNGRFCDGHECSTACAQEHSTIELLRSTTDGVLRNALAVFHFSQSTKAEYEKILGGSYPWRLVEHGIQPPAAAGGAAVERDMAKPSAGVPLKVAFLGGIGVSKGANLVRQIVKRRRLPFGLPIEWHLIGMIDGELDAAVQQHGRYEREALPAIISAVSPHLVAILSLWPETYCYTFDEALACGIPVISTPLGAPAERLREYGCGWLIEPFTAEGVLETLQRVVDNWDEYCSTARRIPDIPLRDVARVARQYHQFYGNACRRAPQATGARRLPFPAAVPLVADGSPNRGRSEPAQRPCPPENGDGVPFSSQDAHLQLLKS